jgi:O-antigen/teichoic acid export membrane protein
MNVPTKTAERTIGTGVQRAWKHTLSFLSKEHILSLADQAVVSGTSFLSTLLIAHFSDADQLGVYAIGLSLVISLLAFQDSLILQPYTIQQYSSGLVLSDRIGSSLILSFLFSAGSISVLTIATSGLLGWGSNLNTVLVLFAITGSLPFVLTREFARRAAIARLEMGRAILLDLVVGVTQLSSLAWLGLTGRMSAISACVALGGASAVAAAGWLYCTRSEFALRVMHVPTIFMQTWALGKWLVLGRMTVQVQSYITYWMVMIISGAAATGVYAACMSIVNVASPVLFAFGNVMASKLVLAWRDRGGSGLRDEAIRNVVLISITMAAFTVAVSFGGERVMYFLYSGNEYAGNGATLTVLALATFAGAVGLPASFGLATMERPRPIVVVGVIGAIVSAVLVGLLLIERGLLGAAYGLLAGNVIGAVGRWVAFLMAVPPECDVAPTIQVMQRFTSMSEPCDLEVTRIGGGEQADVFMIDLKRGLSTRCGYERVVVKLYRPALALPADRVQAQFNSLSDLHAALDSREINGWTLFVPRPLYVCESPLALIMTAVAGHYIDGPASTDEMPKSEVLEGAARAFADAIEQCWSAGQRHGDLGLRNVLFEIEEKTISFIDAGTRESCRTCSEIDKFPSPAVSDLSHVLCDVVRDVMGLIANPSARMGKELFVETVFRAIIENVKQPSEKRWLLNQIWVCLQAHLAECLEPSWSLKGISHFFVKRVALNRARSMLERISDNDLYAFCSRRECHRTAFD